MKRIHFIFSFFALALAAACSHMGSESIDVSKITYGDRSIASIHSNVSASMDSNGTVRVTGRGLKSGKNHQINVYKGGTFIKTYTSNSNGSFSFNIGKSDAAKVGGIRSGDTLNFKILQYHSSSSHEEFYKRVSGSSGGGGYSPPTQPVREPISYRKIQDYANQQARTVANRVVATYGQLENWRFRFIDGFCDAYRAHRTWERGDARRAYNGGYARGEREGARKGGTYGAEEARKEASSNARSSVRNAYRNAVGTGEAPYVEIEPSNIPQFAGLRTSSFRVNREDISDRLNSELRAETRRLSWQYEGWTLSYSNPYFGVWGFREVYTSNCSYVWNERTYFSSSWAWDRWVQNDLGGKYDYNLYKKMIPSERQDFQRAFRSVFSSVIDLKLAGVVRQQNRAAYGRGQYYGKEFGLDESEQNGYHQGIVDTARNASIDAFTEEYPSYYRTAAGTEKGHLDTNAVIESLAIGVIDDENKGYYLPGDSIGIVVSSAVNIGMQDYSESMSIVGSNVSTQRAKTFSLPASSRLESPVSLQSLATVGSPEPNKSFTVRAGGSSKSNVSVSIRFSNVLSDFRRSDVAMKNYILDLIEEERKECIEDGGCYKASRSGRSSRGSVNDGTYLSELVKAATSNSELRSLKSDLQDIGRADTSGGFFSNLFGVTKDRQKRYSDLVNKL